MILRIKTVRTARGLTQQEVAERAGCSREMISSFENARYDPSLKRLEQIATALDVTIYDLLPPTPWRGCPCQGGVP